MMKNVPTDNQGEKEKKESNSSKKEVDTESDSSKSKEESSSIKEKQDKKPEITQEKNKGQEQKQILKKTPDTCEDDKEEKAEDIAETEEAEAIEEISVEEEQFDKEEYIYQKLIKKRNHVYSCIANVLKNYNRDDVLDAFIPEREKIAMNVATLLMTKNGPSLSDFSALSTESTDDDHDFITTKGVISLSAINFLINQVHLLSKEKEGEMEFSKEAKDHLANLALDWAKLRDQAFMYSNGMIKLEYELHDELHFVKTELYHETEKKLKSIGVGSQSMVNSKLQEMRNQRRKMTDRTIQDLNKLVKSWHSEIAYLRRITEFYASMRQLSEEEIEALSLLFENFGTLMSMNNLKYPFKKLPLKALEKLRNKKEKLSSFDELKLLIYETIYKFELSKDDVPYFLCREMTDKDGDKYLQIPVISLLLFSRFCNSYSETTRSKKAHDLEIITSEIATLSGWEIVDQNVEIVSEGDTVTEIDLIIKRNKTYIIIEIKDLALWRGWYFDRESLIKRYEIFVTAAKKLRERRLLLKLPSAKLLIVTALTERWKKADGIPIVPLKSLSSYLKKLKRLESRRKRAKRRR
ncbi:MAG: hypothetical protein U9O98_05505 [Asgard group archaeon]|nr:hypothetical protein [Asgard group archaeon]